ncbi:hypothetical protein MFIFM68171_10573 [Madurella fahalii]|uniref:Golgi pH regulator n=1 Tax=Madurella fahalii TaxID=1157608 RepID=A0ABQ0GRJ4_9PEZI
MLPSDDGDSAACGAGPDGSTACSAPSSSTPTLLLSLTPVVLTFLLVSSVSLTRLFPILANLPTTTTTSNSSNTALPHPSVPIDDGEEHFLPPSAPPSLVQAHAGRAARSPRRRLAALAFAATLGLAAVLAELILAEILEVDDPRARALALRATVPTLVVLLVGVVPFLEAHSVLAARGWRFGRDGKGRLHSRAAWAVLGAVFAAWLVAFWVLGKVVAPGAGYGFGMMGGVGAEEGLWRLAGKATGRVLPGEEGAVVDNTAMTIGRIGLGAPGVFAGDGVGDGGLSRACLERIGVIGISLMALLSGFASVSSPWHTFVDNRAYRKRPITDADIVRKQAGLDATSELLLTKRHRLRSLQRKAQAVAEGIGGGTPHGVAAGPSGGLVGKVLGSIKTFAGSGEAAEIKALQVEISGLETMESNLAASLSHLKSQKAAHARDGTTLGRLLAVPRYAFAVYCVYRILATTLTTLRRVYYPSASFSSSDPINRFLGLLAKHWDPKLDQLAWARQISFLLSGVILAASANSVLQTFRLFAKWAPGLLHQAQANLALLIGQVTATYVISAGLLLRSNLPREVSRSVGDALESALEPGFVDRWFEGWFLLASIGTAAGIWVGRKVGGGFGGGWDEWDELGGEELGQKRS